MMAYTFNGVACLLLLLQLLSYASTAQGNQASVGLIRENVESRNIVIIIVIIIMFVYNCTSLTDCKLTLYQKRLDQPTQNRVTSYTVQRMRKLKAKTTCNNQQQSVNNSLAFIKDTNFYHCIWALFLYQLNSLDLTKFLSFPLSHIMLNAFNRLWY